LRRLASRLVTGLSWLAALSCLPGGALWAVSPLGLVLAEQRLVEGADVFWRLFPAAPLAMALGVVGLLCIGALGAGWSARIGAGVTLLGLLMVIAGSIGQFWLALDETFTVLAPAYYTFRSGLVVLAAGCVILGLAGLREGSVPGWGAIPFVAGAVCGLVAFAWELGTLGSGLWVAFGAGWIWLGSSVALSRFAGFLNGRKPGFKRHSRESD
jgi:hypothetical protein